MYAIACDKCGEYFKDYLGDSCFVDELSAKEKIGDNYEGWVEHNGKHYCPECFEKIQA